MWLLEVSVDEPGCVRLGLVLLGRRRPVKHPMMQRVVLLLRLRVRGAMRCRLMLLPACTSLIRQAQLGFQMLRCIGSCTG